MKVVAEFLLLIAILHCSYAPPVVHNNGAKNQNDSEVKDDLIQSMEYHRYLKEIVEALESDNEFREKLEKADEEEIRSGKIADHLDFVNHNVRTKLDEIKRNEIERLRNLATKQYELTNNIDTDDLSKVSSHDHLDHENPHTFEIEDLKRLIKKTSEDIAEADKKRKEEFKEYEMQKEFEKHKKIKAMNEKERKEFEENLKEIEKQQKQHAPIHHPGSKQQLEEVWEKQDHMENEIFNPKVFFSMHDVDGNGVWDADEVKALFISELDKMYAQSSNHTDLRERYEEMERMREHVFQESDLDRNGLLDYNEFLLHTKKAASYDRDEGWKSIPENQVYSEQEYAGWEKKKLEEMKYTVDAQGQLVPATGQLHPEQQHPQQVPQQYQRQYYPQHPNEIPPQYHQGQIPPQAQMPQYGQMPPQGQIPPQAQMPQYGQMPPQGQMPPRGQMPPQGQIPPQGHMPQYGQIPPQPQMAYQSQIPSQGQPQAGQASNNQIPLQDQVPQGQASPQGPVPPQGQAPPQAQVPPQAQALPQGQALPNNPQMPPQVNVPHQGQAGNAPQH